VIDRRHHLATVVQEEVYRRVQRSFLVALGAALVAAFALGGSFVPIAIAGNLLVVYGLFLAIFGIALAAMLVTQFGGEFGDALAVVVWARLRTEDHWRERGAGRIPVGPEPAKAWLAAHPDEASLPPQRLSAQLSAGLLDDARLTLARYPTTTPYERYDRAADGWFLDFIEGNEGSFDVVDAAAAAIDTGDERRLAAANRALMRAHVAAAHGHDPYPALAAARPQLGDHAAGLVGSRYVMRPWTFLMVVAAILMGVALLVARLTGVWS
jgi:hypothetical protein